MTALARRYVPEKIREIDHPGAGQAANDPLWLMGLGAGADRDAVALVRTGLPTTVIEGLARSLGTSQRDLLAASAIAPATLTRRRNAGGRLTPAESDRIYRIADCLADAIRLFEGDRDAARGWLMEPARALGGATPFEYLATEVGATEVRRLIGRLEHGVYS
ncbi:MAG: antitoxin Xre/MbcA/ParS toxin-binding domain-containing protein [Bdellovibrio bacteriovorus]